MLKVVGATASEGFLVSEIAVACVVILLCHNAVRFRQI